MDHLFSSRDLSQQFRIREASLLEELRRYSEDEILNVAVEELYDYCEAKLSLEYLNVRIEDQTLRYGESEFQYASMPGRRPVPVAGTVLGVTVPFEGDPTLLFSAPSSRSSMYPQAEVDVSTHLITLYYRMLPGDDPAVVKATINRDLEQIRLGAADVNKDLEKFNSSIRSMARQFVEARRARLLHARQQVAALEIPLAKREGAPKTYAIPDVRKRALITKPSPKSERFVPEPTLPETTYEAILEILWLMARVMECSPKAVSRLDEESLRTMFLVQLNAQYEGRATGETFNFHGKTDILIQAEDGGITGHVFVGECKFWDGPKLFLDTIDQILKYITWRDTKTAILFFCRNKDFSAVLSRIPETAAQHPNYLRVNTSARETEFRFTFHRSDDKDREFQLAVLFFHVPVEEETTQ